VKGPASRPKVRPHRLPRDVRPTEVAVHVEVDPQKGDAYQGEVRISCWNRRAEPIVIEPGQRICQLVVVPVVQVRLAVVDSFATTARADGGIGHTGVR